ncbi:MAG TPA: glycoside hydrolase family 2 TIM barrel-domain containing protein [Paludibaculum sp.]|jgi:beta-galactosidase
MSYLIQRRTAIKGLMGAACATGIGAVRGQQANPAGPRQRWRLHSGWKFARGNYPNAVQPDFADGDWLPVTVPHDWSISGPFSPDNPSGQWGGYAPGGEGWYRNRFQAPVLGSNEHLLIEFEGVYRYSEVWLNGTLVGARPNGFVSFELDLTPYLNPGGDNLLAVRADTRLEPSLRWYAGCGIYRHVWLTRADQTRVDWKGTYLTTPSVTVYQAQVNVVTTVRNDGADVAPVRLTTSIYAPDGSFVGNESSTSSVNPGGSLQVRQQIAVPSPARWSPAHPDLYEARSVVARNGLETDEYRTSFGVREVLWDGDRGLLINGRATKLKGVCLHDDLGCLGTAAHDRAIERRLQILKAMGCNAIRTAHNPPAPRLLDLCDSMGMLVLEDCFDKWSNIFPEGDFGSPSWEEWGQRDLSSILTRDRNHPSIILWSVGNEAGAPGEEVHDQQLKILADQVRAEEPSRGVTCALRPQVDLPLDTFAENVARSASNLDVVAVNYQEQYFDLYRGKLPRMAFIATESYPFFRGIVNGFDDVNPWWDTAQRGFVAGQFIWSGFDYLGETAGLPSKGWPNGIIDTCGYPKARSAFHRTVWAEAPVVSIMVISSMIDIDPGLPAWRWPNSAAHWNFEGSTDQPLLLEVLSNCETVELLVNGQSLGPKKPAEEKNWTAQWIAWFVPGTLTAIGRNDGQVVAQQAIQTTGAPVSIVIQADRQTFAADGLDIVHLEVSIVDDQGVMVPNRDSLLGFFVEGPGRIIGTDNGDLRSTESYQSPTRTTFGGRALAIVQSTGAPGMIKVTVRADGLTESSVQLEAR